MTEAPAPREGLLHETRAGYGDTDQSGIVHHAVYLRWLEDARATWLREHGIDFRAMERDERAGFAVWKAEMRYHLPAFFDDLLRVELWVGELGRAKIRFDYRVWREEALLVEAQVHLACIDLDRLRARGLPASVRAALTSA